MKRRTLLQAIVAVLFTWPMNRLRLLAQPAPELTAANVAALGAIAEVVLPSALTQDDRAKYVERFARWIRDYRQGADRGYSYGASTLSQRTGPSPAARYPAQFARLDEAAVARGAASFAALPRAGRREVVEAALDQPPRITNLPGRPNGANLIADFMGYYFSSADAYDLAYEARIGRDSCRGLDGSDLAPQPLLKS
jgi:hypothetical protein